jgi:hypothetical protein
VEVIVKQHGAVVRDLTTRREFVLTAGGEVEVDEKASSQRFLGSASRQRPGKPVKPCRIYQSARKYRR